MDNSKKHETQEESSASLQSQIDELTEGGPLPQSSEKSLRDFFAEKMAEDRELKDKTGKKE